MDFTVGDSVMAKWPGSKLFYVAKVRKLFKPEQIYKWVLRSSWSDLMTMSMMWSMRTGACSPSLQRTSLSRAARLSGNYSRIILSLYYFCAGKQPTPQDQSHNQGGGPREDLRKQGRRQRQEKRWLKLVTVLQMKLYQIYL